MSREDESSVEPAQSHTPTNPWTSRERQGLGIALVAVLALLSGFGSVTFDFVWDDLSLIRDNVFLDQAGIVGKAFGADFWELSVSPKRTGMYRPLVYLSYVLERAVWGTNPAGFHLTNLLIFAWVAGWVTALWMRLGLATIPAVIGGLAFTLHPAQADIVGNISARTDSMMMAFAVPALVAWLGDRPRSPAVPLLFFLALLCKETAATLLVVGVILHCWSRPERRLQARALAIPFAAVVAYLPLRLAALGTSMGDGIPEWWGGLGFVRYLGRLLWPAPMAVLGEPGAPPIPVAVATLALVALVVGAVTWHPRLRPARVPVWIFVLTIAPVSHVLPVTARYADALLHAPLLAWGLVAARLATRRQVAVAVLAIVGVHAVMFSTVLQRWGTARELWEDGVSHNDSHPTIWMNLGVALLEEGEREAGCAAIEEALARVPSDPNPSHAKVFLNLADCRRRAGSSEEAVELYLRSWVLSGGGVPQAALSAAFTEMDDLGNFEEARKWAQRATRVHPTLIDSWKLLGVVEARSGRFDAARRAFTRALALQPADEEARRMLEGLPPPTSH